MPSYDYLEHHGILGQKWGVRRYQNPDGTLTAEGRERLGRKEAKVARKDLKSSYNKVRYASAAASRATYESNIAREKATNATKKNKSPNRIEKLSRKADREEELAKRAINNENIVTNDFLKKSKSYVDKYGFDKVEDLTVDNAKITDARKATQYIAMKGTAKYAAVASGTGLIVTPVFGVLGGTLGGGISALKNEKNYQEYLESLPKGKKVSADDKTYKYLKNRANSNKKYYNDDKARALVSDIHNGTYDKSRSSLSYVNKAFNNKSLWEAATNLTRAEKKGGAEYDLALKNYQKECDKAIDGVLGKHATHESVDLLRSRLGYYNPDHDWKDF